MKISPPLVAALAAGTLLALPAMAAAATDTGLPQICRSQADGGMDMSGMDMGGTTTGTASTAAPAVARTRSSFLLRPSNMALQMTWRRSWAERLAFRCFRNRR